MRSGSPSRLLADHRAPQVPDRGSITSGLSVRIALSAAVLLMGACEPTLERRVFEYERRVNSDNVQGVLELFAENAIYELRDTFVLEGKDALRGLAEWDSVLHTRLTFHDITTLGDSVLTNVSETNDWLSAVGVEELVHPSTLIVFQNGLIVRIDSETDTTGTNAIRRALDEVLAWAVVERPETVHRLVDEAGFRYSGENAATWLKLLREWNAEMSSPRDGAQPDDQ